MIKSMSHEEWYYFIRIVEMIKAKPLEDITPTMFSDISKVPVEKIYVLVNEMVEQNLIQYKGEENIVITDEGWTSYEFQKQYYDTFEKMVNNG